ncbi:MAG: flagellar hook-length control protein FliK [Holosporaceae bacterium]
MQAPIATHTFDGLTESHGAFSSEKRSAFDFDDSFTQHLQNLQPQSQEEGREAPTNTAEEPDGAQPLLKEPTLQAEDTPSEQETEESLVSITPAALQPALETTRPKRNLQDVMGARSHDAALALQNFEHNLPLSQPAPQPKAPQLKDVLPERPTTDNAAEPGKITIPLRILDETIDPIKAPQQVDPKTTQSTETEVKETHPTTNNLTSLKTSDLPLTQRISPTTRAASPTFVLSQISTALKNLTFQQHNNTHILKLTLVPQELGVVHIHMTTKDNQRTLSFEGEAHTLALLKAHAGELAQDLSHQGLWIDENDMSFNDHAETDDPPLADSKEDQSSQPPQTHTLLNKLRKGLFA